MLSKGSARRLPFESIRTGIVSEKTRIICSIEERKRIYHTLGNNWDLDEDIECSRFEKNRRTF